MLSKQEEKQLNNNLDPKHMKVIQQVVMKAKKS
jgi:hypothetical protein